MVELKLKYYELPLNLDNTLLSACDKPLIFYLTHKEDSRKFYPNFVIFDFKQKMIKYYLSYFEANFDVIENYPDQELFKSIERYNIHSVISINENEFNAFLYEEDKYYFSVNIEELRVKVKFCEDLVDDRGVRLDEICSTFYKDDYDSSLIYFSARCESGVVSIFKSNVDFTGLQHIYNSKFDIVPHVTRKVGNFILNSFFDFFPYVNLKSGRKFMTDVDLYDFTLNVLYENYCTDEGIEFVSMKASESCSDDFIYKNKLWNFLEGRLGFKFDVNFKKYLDSRYPDQNFYELSDSIEGCKFDVLPGNITTYNLNDCVEITYETTYSRPAHFEVSTSGDVFVSSHNFVILDRLYYMGPASLDRFKFEQNGLVKIDNFELAEGYRYTSHRVFKYAGKSFMVTFAQPNRFYLIDVDKNEIVHFEDIGKDLLSDVSDYKTFLNSDMFAKETIKEVEVTSDGEFVIFVDTEFVYFFSVPLKKIVTKVKFLDIDEVKEFYKRSTHMQFLK